jgi:signal transduction histidine kinase
LQNQNQIRAYDRQEIQQLKVSLDEMHKNSQESREMATQQGELVKQLQAKINLIENTAVDIEVFQAQTSEVHMKLESAQQNLLTKVEVAQNFYREANHSLNNIHLKEREAIATRVTFQEVVLSVGKDEVARATRLSLSEKTRGDIILKTWEANLVESKRLAWEVKKVSKEACSSLDKESLDIERDSTSEALGQIDIAKN